jgi:hypothetical protein
MWLSYVLIGVIAIAFGAVVFTTIRNKRLGKHSCSCGCSCDACGGACNLKSNKK